MCSRTLGAVFALALAACADPGVQPANNCITIGLFQVASDGASFVAAGRTFFFLDRFVDPTQWRSTDALRLCEYPEPHAGAPRFMVTNERRSETLVVFERNREPL